MKEQKVIISNELGLHARAAAIFAKQAGRFSSDIKVMKNGIEADGKSIMEILTLAAPIGTEIVIKVDGADETGALDSLITLVKDGFGENK